jgi:hypothetical protein
MERGPIWCVPSGTVLVGADLLLRKGRARILSTADFSMIAWTSCADNHALSTHPQEQSIVLIINVSDDFEAGSSRKKIDIAESTLWVHVKAILRKFRVDNRTQAAIWGTNNAGLLRTSSPDSPPLVPGVVKRLPLPRRRALARKSSFPTAGGRVANLVARLSRPVSTRVGSSVH